MTTQTKMPRKKSPEINGESGIYQNEIFLNHFMNGGHISEGI